MTHKGEVFFLVKWKGYDSSKNTWEPLENMKNAEEAIKLYEEKMKTTMKKFKEKNKTEKS